MDHPNSILAVRKDARGQGVLHQCRASLHWIRMPHLSLLESEKAESLRG